jgi:hypothetical protein
VQLSWVIPFLPLAVGYGLFYLVGACLLLLLYVTIAGLLLMTVVVGTIIWIAALVSCLKNESSSDNTKIVWALVILFTHFVGGLLYFIVRRPQRLKELGH